MHRGTRMGRRCATPAAAPRTTMRYDRARKNLCRRSNYVLAAYRAYRFDVHDPDDGGVQQPTETLQSGPVRPAVWERIPARWRHHAASSIAFLVGVTAGVGAVVWRQPGPEPAPFRNDEHAVELVLFQEVPARSHPSGREPPVGPLHVDSALLLSGLVTSTIVAITASSSGLDVRVPALPVTVSPTGRLHEVALKVAVRDCEAAMRWVPGDRPFVITWRDEYGRVHMDRAGDFGLSIADSFTQYINDVCGEPTRQTHDSER